MIIESISQHLCSLPFTKPTLFVSNSVITHRKHSNAIQYHTNGFRKRKSYHLNTCKLKTHSFLGVAVNVSKYKTVRIQHQPLSLNYTPITCNVSNGTIQITQQNGTQQNGNQQNGKVNSSSASATQSAISFNGKVARNSLQALMSYIRELAKEQPFIRSRLMFAVVCMILSKFIGITVPFCFKRVIDTLMTYNTAITSGTAVPIEALRLALYAVLLHGFAKIFTSIAHELRNGIFSRAGQRIGRSVTATSFAHIHSLEVAFHNNSQTGALTRIVDRGTRSVMTIFRGLIFSFLPTVFELILVCTVMFRTFNPWYAMVTVMTFIAYVWWTLRVNDRLGAVRAEMNLVENEASSKLTDSLINVEAVKAFNNSSFELRRYDEALWRYENVATRNEWLYASLNIGQAGIFTVGLTIMLARAVMGVVNGSLTVGSVVMLSSMLGQLWVPLNFLGWQYREVKQSLIDMQNLFDILKRESKIQDAPDAKPLVLSGGEISFENVTFSYPKVDDSLRYGLLGEEDIDNDDKQQKMRQVAINNLSFNIPAGSSLALVGSSGSGKSTVTRLLYRLYDLTQGKILIDGQDISKASLASLRQAVSIVPQDTALFNDTIAYNIRYGNPSASDEEVIQAAKMASIHDVIMRLPDGYNSLVGERGVRFSGGERQRLSVARAFLKGSRIIIEDESTSALDTLTEIEVSKALRKLGIRRTRIIVAHRLSTIIDVDKIVVMKDGEKVEEGSFQELVNKRGGQFKGMWERQQEKSRDEMSEVDAMREHFP